MDDGQTRMAAMLSIQTRPDDAPADDAPATLDAAGLQALASGAVARGAGKSDARARRGPFRPEVWLNARQRHASRLAAHWFRAVDGLAVIALTLLCAAAAAPSGLMSAPLSAILPFAVGAVVLLAALKASGVYGFSRDRRLAVHMGLVSASVAGAGHGGADQTHVDRQPPVPGESIDAGRLQRRQQHHGADGERQDGGQGRAHQA